MRIGLLLIFINFFCFAQQKQGNLWFFGGNCGLNFNNGNPSPDFIDANLLCRVYFECLCTRPVLGTPSVVSDSLGNPLYTTRDFMIFRGDSYKGENIIKDLCPFDYFIAERPFSLSVKAPQKKDLYYLIQTTRLREIVVNKIICPNGFCDMTGTQDSVIRLNQNNKKMTVLQHANGIDYWLLTKNFDTDSINVFEITKQGISYSHAFFSGLNSVGTPEEDQNIIKSSPNSLFFGYGRDVNYELFQFNNATGFPINKIIIPNAVNNDPLNESEFVCEASRSYGAFSSNNKKLYLQKGTNLIQYDISNFNLPAIESSKIVSFDLGKLYDMQIGPNGKIYININSRRSVNFGPIAYVIDCPNLAANLPDFKVLNQYVTPFSNPFPFNFAAFTLFNFPVQNQTFFQNADKLQAIASKRSLCVGDTSRISAFGAGAESFSWSPAAGLNTAIGANVLATPSVTTIYTVSGTGSCNSSVATIRIEVLPKPTVTAINLNPICSGGTALLLTTVTSSGVVSNTWLFTPSGGNLTINQSSISGNNTFISYLYNPTTLGVSTIMGVFTGTNAGCSASDSVQIKVLNPVQNLSFAGSNQTVCSGVAVELGNNSISSVFFPAASNAFQWQVLNSILGAVTFLPFNENLITLLGSYLAPNASKTLQIGLQTTNTFSGCISNDTVSVLLHPAAVQPTISGRNIVCPDVENMVYSASTLEINTQTYNWQIAGGVITTSISGKSINVNWAGSNSLAGFTVSGYSNFGCESDKSVFNVTVNSLISTKTPVGDTVFCSSNGANKLYRVPTFSGSNFFWERTYFPNIITTLSSGFLTLASPNTLLSAITQTISGSNGIFAQNLTTGGVAIINVFEVVTTSSTRCTSLSKNLKITINASPQNSQFIVGLDSLCRDNNAVYSITGFDNSSYFLTVTGAVFSGQNPVKITQNSNLSTINIQEITAQNCVGLIKSKTIKRLDLPISSTILGIDFLCESSPKNQLFETNGAVTSSYDWFLNTQLQVQKNKFSEEITLNSQLSNTLKAIEKNKSGCIGDTLKKVILFDKLNLKINRVSTQVNEDKNIEIDFTTSSFSNRNFSSILIRKPNANANEIQSLSSSFLDALLPTDSLQFMYQIQTKDVCGQTQKSTIQNSILLKAVPNFNLGTISLLWNKYKSTENINYSVLQNIDNQGFREIATLKDTVFEKEVWQDGILHQYRILATINNQNLPIHSNKSKVFSFGRNPVIYTAFTPNNGDNLNNTWVIDSLYPPNKLTIVDKWGNILFEASPYNNDWDGKHNGKDLPSGVYYYLLAYQDRKKAGVVSIFR